jgi:hypothetical protein
MNVFNCNYDAGGDVLYTFLNEPQPANCNDDGAGLIFRTSTATGKPCGITILDFKHTYSTLGVNELCFNIHNFLSVAPLEQIRNKIYNVLGKEIPCN